MGDAASGDDAGSRAGVDDTWGGAAGSEGARSSASSTPRAAWTTGSCASASSSTSSPETDSGPTTSMSGGTPTPSIEEPSGSSHLATDSRNPPLSPGSSVHSWIVPFPNVVSPTSVARSRAPSAPARISLADAVPSSMRTAMSMPGSVARPPARASIDASLAARLLLLVHRAVRQELARHRHRGIDEAAGVVPDVHDEGLDAGFEMGSQLPVEVVRGTDAERVDPQVPDAPVGEDRRADVLLADELAGDRQREVGALALDAQLDVGAAGTADELDRVAHRQSGYRSVVDRPDLVAPLQTGIRGRRVGQDVDDDEPAGIAHRLAGLAGRVLAHHPRSDALELAGDVGQVGVEAIGAHIRRVRVVERLEHRLDRRGDERVRVDLADEVPGDPLVGFA